MACTTGCASRDHASYGDCLRAKSVKVAYTNSAAGKDATRQKKWDREVDRSRDLMAQGILPRNTFGPALDEAERESDTTGKPFRADL